MCWVSAKLPTPSTHPRPARLPHPAHRPNLTMMQLGLLMDHRLTRQSSPPVASSRPEALPSTSEDTLLAWATISSIQGRAEGEDSQGPDRPRGSRLGLILLGPHHWPQKPGGRALLPAAPFGAQTHPMSSETVQGLGLRQKQFLNFTHSHPTLKPHEFFPFSAYQWVLLLSYYDQF